MMVNGESAYFEHVILLVGFWWIFQAHFELRGWAGRLRSLVRILGVILANVVMVFPGASKNLGLTNIFAFIITWM